MGFSPTVKVVCPLGVHPNSNLNSQSIQI